MPTTTTNYGWTKPTIGGDSGNWGNELNTTLDSIDTQVKATDTIAQAALPKAGGTLTGRVDLKTATVGSSALGNVSGATNVDLSVAQAFTATMTGAWQPTFTNVPAGASGVVLKLTNGGSAAITWPASVKWASGSAPGLTAAGTDLLTFVTFDGGATFIGVLSSKDAR